MLGAPRQTQLSSILKGFFNNRMVETPSRVLEGPEAAIEATARFSKAHKDVADTLQAIENATKTLPREKEALPEDHVFHASLVGTRLDGPSPKSEPWAAQTVCEEIDREVQFGNAQ
jgi:hypothetical protein